MADPAGKRGRSRGYRTRSERIRVRKPHPRGTRSPRQARSRRRLIRLETLLLSPLILSRLGTRLAIKILDALSPPDPPSHDPRNTGQPCENCGHLPSRLVTLSDDRQHEWCWKCFIEIHTIPVPPNFTVEEAWNLIGPLDSAERDLLNVRTLNPVGRANVLVEDGHFVREISPDENGREAELIDFPGKKS